MDSQVDSSKPHCPLSRNRGGHTSFPHSWVRTVHNLAQICFYFSPMYIEIMYLLPERQVPQGATAGCLLLGLVRRGGSAKAAAKGRGRELHAHLTPKADPPLLTCPAP